MMLAAMNWHAFYFYLFAGLACLFAFGVLFSSNVVRMAANLIASLAATAALFMLAGAEFVGAMQIMIYVGGTLVLLIFGVMLTAQASFISMKTSAAEWIIAAIVGGSLLFLLGQAAFMGDNAQGMRMLVRQTQRDEPRDRELGQYRQTRWAPQLAKARRRLAGMPYERAPRARGVVPTDEL